MEEDGGAGGDVERVDLARHGEVGEVVAEGFNFGADAEVLGAEDEGGGEFGRGELFEGDGIG